MEVNMFENLTDDELLLLLDDGKTSQEKILEALLSRDIKKDILLYLIEFHSQVRRRAWQKYLQQIPSNYELRYIIANVESLRPEAVIRLCSRDLSEEDLDTIMCYSESNRQEAQERLLDLNHNRYQDICA